MWFSGEPNESRLSSLEHFILFVADRRVVRRLIVASLLWAITMPLCRCYNMRDVSTTGTQANATVINLTDGRKPCPYFHQLCFSFTFFFSLFCVITHGSKGPFLSLCGTERAAITYTLIQKGISFSLGYLYSWSISLGWQGREQDVGNGNCLARAASQHAPHLEPNSSRQDRASCQEEHLK